MGAAADHAVVSQSKKKIRAIMFIQFILLGKQGFY